MTIKSFYSVLKREKEKSATCLKQNTGGLRVQTENKQQTLVKGMRQIFSLQLQFEDMCCFLVFFFFK